MEATKQVKPSDGRYQTATQVKVLSPAIYKVREVDSFHLLEGRTSRTVVARYGLLSRGLSPWYGIERKQQELGRARILLQRYRKEEGGNKLEKGKELLKVFWQSD